MNQARSVFYHRILGVLFIFAGVLIGKESKLLEVQEDNNRHLEKMQIEITDQNDSKTNRIAHNAAIIKSENKILQKMYLQ